MKTCIDIASGKTYVEAAQGGVQSQASQHLLFEDFTFAVSPRLAARAEEDAIAASRPSISLIESCLAQFDSGSD